MKPPRTTPLRWGTETVELLCPPGARILEPEPVAALEDLESAVAAAVESPVGRPPLAEVLRGKRKVAVLVPDKTRHAHTRLVLAVVLRSLRDAGLREADLTIVVAAGDHPQHSDAELAEVVGPDLLGRLRIVEHRAVDEEACVEVGRTSRGTPVRLNCHVVEADAVVLIGVVVRHYFAGFGGGPKAVFPGAAARSSIRANHGLVMAGGDKDPRACAGRLDGNPVHEDLCEAVGFVEPAFLINVVNDGADRPLAFFAGHWRLAHREACAFLERASRVEAAPGTFDLLAVSAGGAPHDLNLVQAHKAIDACAPLLADGGRMLVLARCPQGYGDPDLSARLTEADESALLAVLNSRFVVKAHTALCMLRKARRLRIHVAGELEAEPLERAGMCLETEPAAAWERIISSAPRGARIGLVPAGQFVTPTGATPGTPQAKGVALRLAP